ncbi:NAD-dependent epimerase/dehydratase family protein [Sporolactobacillus kofuensis]|uniref:NAD-dependent epimerase/dehydratase family protein n=1 Tax=Sporolactobacillus kofuensis TaxID=269672 RepID=A0ABW1WDV2_9BACL|nr:NAD-dependent epimerase/dehydratase family protein [Sporolactobacillus kofuensis]MCO7176119.1 NAD-dependent epimerase/dehydratase family protein [Sporolactobacillus kofuensis]
MKKMIVLGGSGFIGRHVCQELINQGKQVVSISSHGRPAHLFEAWTTHEQMTWIAADIFNEEEWLKYCDDCSVMIDLIGILWESKERSYQHFIVDPAKIMAQFLLQHPEASGIFVSAALAPPLFGRNYLKAKRQAEAILKTVPQPVQIFRPSLVYGKQRPISQLLAFPIKTVSMFPSMSFIQPIRVETLAKQIVMSIPE